jgi:hypothetical protein
MHTISTTSPRALDRLPTWLQAVAAPDARQVGASLCLAGLVLVWIPRLWTGALGVELLAAAFWVWARAAQDRDEQLPRWRWLRRPALALWLAAAAQAAQADVVSHGALPTRLATLLVWAQALGVAWAGLELLAALPLARPFSDRSGPLLAVGPWLPALLPSTGFVILWRHVEHWTAVPEVRRVALFLLILTAVLATVRAFSRGRWVASLRWLIVADCVLAAMLVALAVLPQEVTLLLWLSACGGRVALLAGELRGMAPRRVAASHVLWRISGWVSTACLSWPLLATLGFGPQGIASPWSAAPTAFAVALGSWVAIRRMVEAPERRAMVRRESAVSLSRLAAALTLVTGPIALVMAWWSGFESPGIGGIVAAAPALGAGALAWWLDRHPAQLVQASEQVERQREVTRGFATVVFRFFVAVERRVVSLLVRFGHALLAPSRDLHTGDAQEYLLFLIGLSAVALFLPLLR